MSSRKKTSLSLDHTPAEKACQSDPQISPLDSILLKCIAELKSWKPPPNLSAHGWFQELEQLARIAAWQAVCHYEVGATTPIEAFVYLRIRERVLTCYRREWSYSLRFVLKPLNAPECGHPLPEGEGWSEGEVPVGQSVACPLEAQSNCNDQFPVQQYDAIRDAVASLPPPERFLVEERFWGGRTQQELGRMLKISQRMVSKKMQAALQLLRDQIAVEAP